MTPPSGRTYTHRTPSQVEGLGKEKKVHWKGARGWVISERGSNIGGGGGEWGGGNTRTIPGEIMTPPPTLVTTWNSLSAARLEQVGIS